jgi:PTS system ascorbate-specific IIA component
MAVGLLLITHPGVGDALLTTATRLLGQPPLRAEAFAVPYDADLGALLPGASAALRRVDGGEGVLLMTDIYGASPARLAYQLGQLGTPCRRVSGVSLPMLLRVLNYADHPLESLLAIAQTGGKNGVVADDA